MKKATTSRFKPERDYKALYETLKIESEAFSVFYDERIKVQTAFMVFGGVIMQMESDRIAYVRKNGENEKIRPLKERISILQSLYNDLSGLDEKNVRLIFLLNEKNKSMYDLECENERLKLELEAIEKAFKAE